MPNIRVTMIAGIVSAFIIIILLSMYRVERAERISYQDKLKSANETIGRQLELARKQSAKIKLFNELSIKSAEEITSAKKEIDNLRSGIRSGIKRVYVKASCPKPMPDANSAGGLVDAGAARLTETAREDYLRLREMMAENLQQTKYLQEYIRTQYLVKE